MLLSVVMHSPYFRRIGLKRCFEPSLHVIFWNRGYQSAGFDELVGFQAARVWGLWDW